MAWLQLYSVLFFCSSVLVIVETIPFQEYGVITVSNGTYKFVGDSLELYCNITNTSLRENSSMLHFERWTKKDERVIPREHIEILTTKTIRLRLANISISDAGTYTCFLSKFAGDVKIVDSQIIRVDYKPQKVKDISCRVYNWEKMNCTWDLGVQFQYPEYVKVYLTWTIELPKNSRSYGEQFDCPNLKNTFCLWNTYDYMHGHLYFMVVDVSIEVNGKVLITERSNQFRVETALYVEPAPVEKLQANVVNSTCVQLSWQHSAIDRPTFFVAESRVSDRDKWSQIILSQESENSYKSPVCSLEPFTNYTFRMSVLPYPIETTKPVNQGHRSEWRTVSAKTLEDVPGAAPKICSSCFHEFKCPPYKNYKSLRCVEIYWQDLEENEKHGIITNYTITYVDSEHEFNNSLQFPVSASETLTSVNFTLPVPSQNFQISISAATSKGFSRNSSYILLPSIQRKPSVPSSFLVEIDKKNENKEILFYLSWAALNVDAKTGLKYTNITIVWCHNIRSETKCRGEIHWVQLPADHVTYELKPTAEGHQYSDFLIGITAEVFSDGQTVSSGIYWSTCTYHHNEPPQNAPKNVRESSKHPNNGLTILWDKFECIEEKSFITEYLVKYCPAREDKLCYEPERSLNVSNMAGEVTLEHLKDNVRYLVTVMAISTAGLGPPTSNLTVAVKGEKTPGQDYSRELIIGGVFGLSLILIVLVILVRRCRQRRKNLPSTSDIIRPYAQSSVDFPNKIRQGFQNRPLPKTPEEQHVYGLSACMNNHGCDKSTAAESHNSESNSEESVTSQTNLLSLQAQIDSISPTEISNKSHLKKDPALNKEMQFSTKEAEPLLDHNSSRNVNGPFDIVNDTNMLEQNTSSAVPCDYSTMGYIYIENDIPNDRSHTPKEENVSAEASSLSIIPSSSENLDDYYLFAAGSSRSNSIPDPRGISCSNTNTLPLRECNMEMPDCPSLGLPTKLQTITPFSTSVSVGHGGVSGLNQPLVYTTNKPENLGYSQKYPTSSSHVLTVGEVTLLSSTPRDNMSKGNKSEYMAHSQMACQPSGLLKNNKQVDYSRFAETTQDQRHNDSLQPCLNYPPSSTSSTASSTSSTASSCSDGTHCTTASCCSSDTKPQFFINNTSNPNSASIAQTSIVPNNDYTSWEAFSKAPANNYQSALSTCLTTTLGKEVSAHPSFVTSISPALNLEVYVDHLPYFSPLPNEEEIAAENYDYNSAGSGATFPRSVDKDSIALPLPSPLTRPLSGDLLQLPPEYYEDPKLGGSHDILTEL